MAQIGLTEQKLIALSVLYLEKKIPPELPVTTTTFPMSRIGTARALKTGGLIGTFANPMAT